MYIPTKFNQPINQTSNHTLNQIQYFYHTFIAQCRLKGLVQSFSM
jgi:hypothetical protein